MNEQLQSTDAEPRPQLSPEFLASSNWTSALGGAEIIVRGVNKREQRKWVAFPYHRFAELGILQRSVLAGFSPKHMIFVRKKRYKTFKCFNFKHNEK